MMVMPMIHARLSADGVEAQNNTTVHANSAVGDMKETAKLMI
jgi:hypothetical protein